MNKVEFFRGMRAQRLKEGKEGHRGEWTCTERERHVCKRDCDGEVDFASILKGLSDTYK